MAEVKLRISYPSWYTANDWKQDPKSITPEQIAKYKEETDVYNAHANEKNKTLISAHKELIAKAENLYGENHKTVKYIRAASPALWVIVNWNDFVNTFQSLIDKINQEELKNKNDEEKKQYLQDAIVWLQERGKTLGTDFTLDSAVYEANRIAVDEAIKKMNKYGVYHSFGGDDNCVNCEGWNGIDKRCECGNRRLYWDHEGDFKNMHIYP